MYTIIDNDPFFDDIKSDKAKNNFDRLVDYLCSSLVPNGNVRSIDSRIIVEDEILIDGDYKTEHLSFAKEFYSSENLELAEEILKNRTNYTNINSCDPYKIDGFSYIYQLDRDKIIRLGTMKFYYSIATMEHELIHILMALNNNNLKPQHAEILSFFGELLSLIHLSKKHNNPNIYENALINRCIARMSYRVFASDFDDESIRMRGEAFYKTRCDSYPHMLGFIYAIRLLNIFNKNPGDVLSRVNDVLSGKYSVEELLNNYNISLTDENTCNDFISLCDQFRDILNNRYSPNKLHSAR